MQILKMFDGYLLIMVAIQGVILFTVDYNYYEENGYLRSAKAAKIIGVSIPMIFAILYIIQKILL